MSKILAAKKAEQVIVNKRLAKLPVKRAQSSNALPLLKSVRVAPKLCQSSTQQQIHARTATNKQQSSPLVKEQLNIIYMKMLHQRKFAVVDPKAVPTFAREEALPRKKHGTANSGENVDIKVHKNGQKNASAAKKWTSALRVVSAMTRLKNLPKKEKEYDAESRGSSFSTSNESTPSRTYPPAAAEQDAHQNAVVDPVYLALKQATTKYGAPSVGGCSSGRESRRDSQNAATPFDAETLRLSARNLSQTSLYDSGNHSENELMLLLLNARSGSTPQLHGISVPRHLPASRRDTSLGISAPLNGTFSQAEVSNRVGLCKSARTPKLSSQMKSFSLDCADIMPASPPVQSKNGGIRHNYYMHKPPIRSARAAFVSSGGGEQMPTIVAGQFERREKRTESACGGAGANGSAVVVGAGPAGLRRQRRLPPVPTQTKENAQTAPSEQPPIQHTAKLINCMPQLLHIVTHEYASSECALRPGDRLVVVDNGDPDWKHGFKLNDRLEQLITFPSSCVASYKAEEQPMRLLQSCNLSDQKLRLYRDQVVFAQPDSLSKDGKVMVRNEHDKFAKCPLQFLSLA
ncbi:hypothetical protein niasHT_000389 [Heterodera trifolii]|uniref:STAC3-related SH3 domain-containing protein n=1 Tax=Heterodera trifolii TaxID=157864 RepID=A0ABD2M186_9BILA